MPTEEMTPAQSVDIAVQNAALALENLRLHQDAERSRYETKLQKLIDLAEELRTVNPKAKRLPLQPGERTGYNMSNRLLEEALRECTPMERDAVQEFRKLITHLFGPAGQ